jgi:S-adenosylmethionine:tRNA ribosyltransferase-isomerase
MPSAGRPLSAALVLALKRRGVSFAWLTHAAGLSSTGDPAIDAVLPLTEAYEIPRETVDAVSRCKGRVIAVGTSVVRALEGNAATHGRLTSGRGETDLVIRPGFRPRVVDGLLSGMHDGSTTHYQLLAAFATEALLEEATRHAETEGYLCHEFGDACLILSSTSSPRASRS